MKPNTRIKISGKARLKITAEGLLSTAVKLAFVIAHKAEYWLYFTFISSEENKNYFRNF
jgi:hypothetical protein